MARLLGLLVLLTVLAVGGCPGTSPLTTEAPDGGGEGGDIVAGEQFVAGLNANPTSVGVSGQVIPMSADTAINGIVIEKDVENTTIDFAVPMNSFLAEWGPGLWLRVFDPDFTEVATSPTLEVSWTPTISGIYEIWIMAPGVNQGGVAVETVSVYFE